MQRVINNYSFKAINMQCNLWKVKEQRQLIYQYQLKRKHGKGIETNVVTLCTNLISNKYHYKLDNGTKEERQFILDKITKYMKSIYSDDWNIEDQIYKK